MSKRLGHAEWCNVEHMAGKTPCTRTRQVQEVRCIGCGASLSYDGATQQLIEAFIDIHNTNCGGNK